MKKRTGIKQIAVILAVILLSTVFIPLYGCSCGNGEPALDPKNPLTIKVWHYYSGALQNAFDNMTQEFNDTVGKQRGIIVEASSYSLSNLEKATLASAKNEVGSDPLPNIFASYADTAYEIEKLGKLADLGTYFKKEDQAEYIDSYIEEGKIGLKGELRIFPIAKSTEVLWINETDWLHFAQDYGYTYNDLSTYEKLVDVAADYYDWSSGKAFFGRDVLANLFLSTSKAFSQEIFNVSKGKCTLNVNDAVMKKLWDYYYVPIVSGYFSAEGRYRSDDAKVGGILSYVGSTASAPYAPNEVTIGGGEGSDGVKHSITGKILPLPHFSGGSKVMIQQGAGMAVTKGTDKQEFASIVFLKWFTDTVNNSLFSAKSGYLPVKKAAANYDSFKNILNEKEQQISPIADETLKIVFNQTDATFYASKAFDGGVSARNILETHLANWADADRKAILASITAGTSHADAVAQYNTTQNFNEWLASFKAALTAAIS